MLLQHIALEAPQKPWNQSFWFPENSELRMGHKADSANVGCKVIPICDAVSTGSNGGDSSDGSEKDVQKGERRRAVSQMKELLTWAAAARSHKCGSKGWKVKTQPMKEAAISFVGCSNDLKILSFLFQRTLVLISNLILIIEGPVLPKQSSSSFG